MRAITAGLLFGCVGLALGVGLTLVILGRTPLNGEFVHKTGGSSPVAKQQPALKSAAPDNFGKKDSGDALAEKKPTPAGYILDTDVAWVNKRMTARVKRLVEETMAQRDADYELLFAKLGIESTERHTIKNRIAQLYRKKAEAGIIMTEWVIAQSELEQYMKSVSGEGKDEYLAFEDATRSRLEANKFASFCKENGASVSEAEFERLRVAIQSQAAYTQHTLGGAGSPFDEVAMPFTGRAIVPKFQEQYQGLAASVAALLESKGVGLNDAAKVQLERYYSIELASYEEAIRRAGGR